MNTKKLSARYKHMNLFLMAQESKSTNVALVSVNKFKIFLNLLALMYCGCALIYLLVFLCIDLPIDFTHINTK